MRTSEARFRMLKFRRQRVKHITSVPARTNVAVGDFYLEKRFSEVAQSATERRKPGDRQSRRARCRLLHPGEQPSLFAPSWKWQIPLAPFLDFPLSNNSIFVTAVAAEKLL